jgi:hypothetical protein
MNLFRIASLIALFGLVLWGCNPSENVNPDDDATVSARLSGDTTGFHCKNKLTRIEVSALPAAVTAAISASYAGASIQYAAKDDTGNFLVGINQNNDRKTLLFNADGTFNREFTHRGGGNGPRGKRDSLTQIAPADLPAAIRTYIAANYAGAVINTAAKDANRGYVVMITQNEQRKGLFFNLDGTFNKEVGRKVGDRPTLIAASALPANVTSYITANYAGSTIKAAGKTGSGTFKVMIQTTKNELIELSFAADGTFVQAKTRKK